MYFLLIVFIYLLRIIFKTENTFISHFQTNLYLIKHMTTIPKLFYKTILTIVF